MPANDFGFKGYVSSHWACDCSSLYLFPFPGSIWAVLRDIPKLFWCRSIRSLFPAIRVFDPLRCNYL